MAAKNARRKNLMQFLTLLLAVAVVLAVFVLAQQWWNNRPGPDPRTVELSVTTPDGEKKITPFLACDLGKQCPENEVPEAALGAEEQMTISLPEEVAAHEWALLKIYDQEAANDESLFKAHERNSIDISGSSDPLSAQDSARPRLQVVEIKTVMIGTDDAGEESPYSVVWSLKITE